MSEVELPLVIESSLLGRFPFVVHGFGTRYFQDKELTEFCQEKNLKPICLNQAHSNCLHYLESPPAVVLEGDALITSKPGLLLIIKTADCLPVLLLDPINRVVASAHCGWRGTASRLLEKLIDFLSGSFGSRPENLIIAFGPCISRDCYEVSLEVKTIFRQAGFSLDEELFRPNPLKSGNFYLDLRLANRSQLLASGIKKEKIEEITFCSHCHQDLLSFRRDGAKCGRLLNFIALINTGQY